MILKLLSGALYDRFNKPKQLSVPLNNYPGLNVFAPVYARGKSCCDGSGCFSFFHSTTIYLVFHGDPFSFTYCCDRLRT